MGMYDSIIFKCKECEKAVEFQTKDGLCNLDRFTLKAIPQEIAIHANKRHCKCDCGVIYRLTIHKKKQSNVSDCVIMKAKPIRFDYGDYYP